MKILFTSSLLLLSFNIIGQTFTDIQLSTTGVDEGSVIWGDYDNDDDLDFFFVGTDLISLGYISGLYQNNSGVFTLMDNELKNIVTTNTVASWGDYDNDNDIDLIVDSKIYQNEAGVFTDINANLISLSSGSVSWGDYDNDNDLDLLMSGYNGSNNLSIIYRNDNGNFININAGLTGISIGSGKWGDFDNDGDIDVLLVGSTGNSGEPNIGKVYTNTSNVFSEEVSFDGISSGSADWGDFDNDGDLDIIASGNGNSSGTIAHQTKLYINNGGSLAESTIELPNLVESRVGWIDFDLDGSLDLMLIGENESNKSQTYLYRNENGANLTTFETNFINVSGGSFDWGDYDSDELLDLVISGNDNNSGFTFNLKVYKQDNITPPTFSLDNSALELNEDFEDEQIIAVTPDNNVEATYLLTPESVEFCSISINSQTGQVTIQSISDLSGEQVFTITATDIEDESNTASQQFSLTVLEVNDQPQILQLTDDISIPENSSIEILLSNLVVTDVDNTFPDDFTLSVLTGSNYSIDGNVVTPNQDFVGQISVPVRVNDGQIDSEVFDVAISVTEIVPTFSLDNSALELNEDFEDEQIIAVTPDNSVEASYSLTPESVEFCSISINSQTGQVTIQSISDLSGEQVFTITATDIEDESNTASQQFSLTVLEVNDQPQILQLTDDISIPENSSIEILLSNLVVTDVDNTFPDDFTLTVLTGSNYSIAENVVTPNQDFVGQISVPVRVNDGQIDSEVFDVAISVTEIVPTFSLDNSALELNEDFEDEQIIAVSPDNSVEATYSLTPESVEFCSIYINSQTGQVTIQSISDLSGEQVFTITATDIDNQSNTASQQFSLTVLEVNDQPQILQLTDDISIPENSSIEILLSNLVVTDVDNTFPDDFTLSVLTGSNYSIDGNVVTPNQDFVGQISVPVRVNDGQIDSEVFDVAISVTEIVPTFSLDNSALELNEDFEDEQIIAVTPYNSVEATYSLTPESVEFCSIYINSQTGQVTIQSISDLSGEQVFTITATDIDNQSNTASQQFSLTVLEVNDQPQILQLTDDISIPENSSIEILLSNLVVTDVDNTFPDDFTLTVLTGSDYSIVGNVVTPNQDFVGQISVPVRVNDGQIDSDIFDVAISVTNVLGSLDQLKDNNFLIYPNPASGHLIIHSKLTLEEYKIKIFSLNGELIRSYVDPIRKVIKKINISDIQKGHYLLQIENNNKFITLKFVKM